jgi:phage gpG-like protein
MKQFSSLLQFSEHLMKAATVEILAISKGLEVSAKAIQAEAKNEIGHLQSAVGPFPEWEELADSTKAEKERLGYVFNKDYNPLLRTGELIRDSIEYEVNMESLEAIIGSKEPVAAFQEFGTDRIPPRPFIGRAAFILGPKIAKIFGDATMIGIAGGNLIANEIGHDLGYHREI